MSRHPSISVRTSEHVTGASANVGEKDIRKWLSDIHKYLEDNDYSDILNDPDRLFNGDETGFSLCPKTKNVLAPKGSKDVYEVATGNPKENLTVMFTFNALGKMCYPMIIYNYKRIPLDVINSVPTNWGVGHSDTGWMKSEVFYEYIANIFHPFLIEKCIKLPVILFVDGHKSHLTYQLSHLCSDLGIILIALYPNSTRILQPADVAAFRPLKSGWKNGVFEWRKNNNMYKAVSKKDFAPILNKVIEETVKPDTLKNGFKACGLFPWNPNEIDYRKCLGKNGPLINIDKEHTDNETYFSNALLNDNTLNITMFSEIVGPETMDKLKNINRTTETEKNTEELYILHKLFESLKKNADFDSSSECPSVLSENVVLNSDNILNSSLEENKLLHVPPNDNDSMFCVNPCAINTNITLNDKEKTTIKRLKVSPLQECLVWPLTPERKGKRQTERLPFVISSQMWKNIHEHKEDLKKITYEEKEERKRKRDENKQLKFIKKPTKTELLLNKRKIC